MRLDLGTPVRCSDGEFGKVVDIVIDPTKRRVTHLAVEPHGLDGMSRLVPVELAQAADDGDSAISLRCTVEEVQGLPHVQAASFLQLGEFPAEDPDWDVGIERVLAMPYYESPLGNSVGGGLDASTVLYDRVPKGEVELRRASVVNASDGRYLGHVDGFLVDAEEQITHFVLERGHLWGRREVTIPIGAVTKIETDAVTLGLSEAEVGALPSLHVRRWF